MWAQDFVTLHWLPSSERKKGCDCIGGLLQRPVTVVARLRSYPALRTLLDRTHRTGANTHASVKGAGRSSTGQSCRSWGAPRSIPCPLIREISEGSNIRQLPELLGPVHPVSDCEFVWHLKAQVVNPCFDDPSRRLAQQGSQT